MDEVLRHFYIPSPISDPFIWKDSYSGLFGPGLDSVKKNNYKLRRIQWLSIILGYFRAKGPSSPL